MLDKCLDYIVFVYFMQYFILLDNSNRKTYILCFYQINFTKWLQQALYSFYIIFNNYVC